MYHCVVMGSKNIMAKEENASKQHFFIFPTMFSIPSKTNFKYRVTSIMSSAHIFNLDQSKIFLSCKELTEWCFSLHTTLFQSYH